MKLICSQNFKLRSTQSIHDICLAGDYIVIFESSISLSLKKLVISKAFLNSLVFDESLPVLMHIYKKEDLSFVKTIETEPFFIFHFTNGYSTDKKIVVEYARYNAKDASTFFNLIEHIPNYGVNSEKEYNFSSVMEEVNIDLETMKFTFINREQ